MPAPHRVPVIRAGDVDSSAATEVLHDVAGTPVAEVGTAPPLAATLTVSRLRATPPVRPPSAAAIAEAGRMFATATLDGLRPRDYCELHARSTGVPIAVSRHSLTDIAASCERVGDRVAAERPAGAVGVGDSGDSGGVGNAPGGLPEPGEIRPIWTRRGDMLSVIAPSNNPGTHTQWLHALAFGYHLIIRPGTRDPLTPQRLIAALLAAGVEPERLSLLPGGHATADALVDAADMSLVFGGDTIARRYGGDPRVVLRGPGRSKILHTGALADEVLDVLCDSVAYDAGLRCTNTTAIFTDGDPRALGEAMAARLGKLTAAPPVAAEAELPVLPTAAARALRAHLDARREDAVDMMAHADGGVAELGDGSAALRPAVLVCDRADHAGARVELPFPCVWVLPWQPEDGMIPLRDTLALTIISDDATLPAAALAERSIRQVAFGPVATYEAGPVSPHDGYLSRELMEVRAYGTVASAAGS